MHDVILLAGGKGDRMASELPKPLVPVKGKPILFHQIDYFLPHTTRIIISTGHRAQEIEDAVKAAYPIAPIVVAREHKPLGTAGGIKLAAKQVTSEFVIVLNCDNITNIVVPILQGITENTIVVGHPVLPFGLVEERDGFAMFKEKPTLPLWVSCGWYVLQKNIILQEFPDVGSIEYDVFPRIKVRIYRHEGWWKDLGTKKDIQEWEKL